MTNTLQFNPSFREFQIAQTGIIDITKDAGSNTGTATVDHSLQIKPVVIAYIDQLTIDDVASGSGQMLPYLEFDLVAGTFTVYVSAHTSPTQVRFRVFSPDATENSLVEASIKYYLLIERTS